MTAPSALAINGVSADFAAETLRDRDGAPVPLRKQAFAVLRHLAANPGRVVTKDELMAAVWSGIAVTDDSLVQCIGGIRRALGDEKHAVVRTVPRRGYRLVLPEPPNAGPGRPARRCAFAAGASVLALLAAAALAWSLAGRSEAPVASVNGPPVVAVVPFIDVAGDDASQALVAGCGWWFLQDLARFREFQIVGRSATFVYQDQPAGALAVDYVLGGSIRREGDRLRISAELTEAATGDVLWSERWDRPDRDVPAAAIEISEQISNRLGGATGLVQSAGRAVAQRKRPGDRTAHELYLLGTEQLASGTRAGATEAVTLLARSVELDPGFARASAELALAHGTLAEFGVEPDSNARLAAESAERAVFLDGSDAWGHAALGVALRQDGDLVRARSEFDTALVLAPNAAEILTLHAGWAATGGEPERGATMADRVARLDPDFPPRAAARFARSYFMAGRYRAALAMIDRLPADALTRSIRAMHAAALAAVGRPEEAAAAVIRAEAAAPDISIETMANAPGYGDAERRRLVETMRLAGFPPCAGPEVLAKIAAPLRQPECAARAEAAAP